MVKIRVDKKMAAARQLDAAIKLYFSDGDQLAIHTLAGAALGVLVPLANDMGISDHPLSEEWVKQNIREEKIKEYYRMLAGLKNFLKHADTDPDGTFEFDDEVNGSYLFMCGDLYGKVYEELSIVMFAYQLWFSYHHPDILYADFGKQLKEAVKGALPANVSERDFASKALMSKALELATDQVVPLKHRTG